MIHSSLTAIGTATGRALEPRHYVFVLVAAAIGAGGMAHGQPAASPAGSASRPTAAPVATLKAGAMVTDRMGVRLGPIQTLTDAARGPMAIIEIDGKLVGVPAATLTPRGDDAAVSSQTKAEIIAAAGAPP